MACIPSCMISEISQNGSLRLPGCSLNLLTEKLSMLSFKWLAYASCGWSHIVI